MPSHSDLLFVDECSCGCSSYRVGPSLDVV